MPSVQKRVVSVAEEIATLRSRVQQLATFPAAMTGLSNDSSGNVGPLAYSGGAIIAATETTPLTLIRPIPLIATSTISVYTPTVGTATSVTMFFGMIVNGVDNGSIAEVFVYYKPGQGMLDASRIAVIDGATWLDIMDPANGNGTWPVTVKFYWLYQMTGGATTTLTLNQWQTIVFQAGG